MKVRVYVVVTYYGSSGDAIEVFGSEDEALACLRSYAEYYWDSARLGPMPSTLEDLTSAWDNHDLWGSCDSRWEFEVREVEVPDPRAAAA